MTRRLSLIVTIVCFAVTAFAAPGERPSGRALVDAAERAAEALFVRSDIAGGEALATAALKKDPQNGAALLVRMEAAALTGNDEIVVESALRLCASPRATDEEKEIAAARIRDLAGNTRYFRSALPQIQKLIRTGDESADQLRAALVRAASDGAPELDLLLQSRDSGLLTDWKILGPLGRRSNIDFDRRFAPEMDGFNKLRYGSAKAEYFQFADGKVALPEYKRSSGVYYAGGDVFLRSGGEWRLRVESPGTLQVFVDGHVAASRDDRRQTQPEVSIVALHLEGGTHRVLVKFMPSAAPFRIAVMAPVGGLRKRNNKPQLHAGPEAEYVLASLPYWRGDAAESVRRLRGLTLRQNSASVQLLLSSAWSRMSVNEASAPEQRGALISGLKLAPDATAVRLALAGEALEAERDNEATSLLKRAAAEQPNSSRTQQLIAQLAIRMHWPAEAIAALDKLVAAHPSCDNLRQAASYFASQQQFRRASALEPTMAGCAPASLTFAHWLADAGRHTEAAEAAARVARDFPMDRDARAFEIRELVLAGDTTRAQQLARDLAEITPSSPQFNDWASRASDVLNTESTRSAGFDTASEFYAKYRRDGVALVRDAAPKKYSGGPAVMLLNDRVAELREDGSGSVYVHSITRVLNRDGIEQYGEAAIPHDAHLLELRTIKADLSIAEPEFNQHKTTVSMPALAPGDAIEQEYVLDFPAPDALDAHARDFEFAFGSFAAPMLYARFVLIAPQATQVAQLNGAADPKSVTSANNVTTRLWEREAVPQSIREAAMPRRDVLPVVRPQLQSTDVERLRDTSLELAIGATHAGLRAEFAAASLKRGSDLDTARAALRYVVAKIRPDGSSFTSGDVTCAEESLAAGEGSRTAALLAIARAAGLRADFAMARVSGGDETSYDKPLVVLHLSTGDITVDAETDGMPFGSTMPNVDRANAIIMPLDAPLTPATVAALPGTPQDERSLAEADIDFDQAGSFSARVSITMSPWRGSQMREILSGIAPAERPRFFEQLAMRLFPGARDAQGSVQNENDADIPLVITVSCRSPHFLDFSAQRVDMDQLAPALGLKRMYANAAQRKFPLYVDALLFETSTFRVHLPENVRVLRTAPDASLESQFGSYGVTFRATTERDLEIRREFHVPTQVVEPAQYAAFNRFATQIDDAERQRLTLETTPKPLESSPQLGGQ